MKYVFTSTFPLDSHPSLPHTLMPTFPPPLHPSPQDWDDLAGGEHSVYAFSPLTQYQIPEATTFNLLGDDKGKDKVRYWDK